MRIEPIHLCICGEGIVGKVRACSWGPIIEHGALFRVPGSSFRGWADSATPTSTHDRAVLSCAECLVLYDVGVEHGTIRPMEPGEQWFPPTTVHALHGGPAPARRVAHLTAAVYVDFTGAHLQPGPRDAAGHQTWGGTTAGMNMMTMASGLTSPILPYVGNLSSIQAGPLRMRGDPSPQDWRTVGDPETREEVDDQMTAPTRADWRAQDPK